MNALVLIIAWTGAEGHLIVLFELALVHELALLELQHVLGRLLVFGNRLVSEGMGRPLISLFQMMKRKLPVLALVVITV